MLAQATTRSLDASHASSGGAGEPLLRTGVDLSITAHNVRIRTLFAPGLGHAARAARVGRGRDSGSAHLVGSTSVGVPSRDADLDPANAAYATGQLSGAPVRPSRDIPAHSPFRPLPSLPPGGRTVGFGNDTARALALQRPYPSHTAWLVAVVDQILPRQDPRDDQSKKRPRFSSQTHAATRTTTPMTASITARRIPSPVGRLSAFLNAGRATSTL